MHLGHAEDAVDDQRVRGEGLEVGFRLDELPGPVAARDPGVDNCCHDDGPADVRHGPGSAGSAGTCRPSLS